MWSFKYLKLKRSSNDAFLLYQGTIGLTSFLDQKQLWAKNDYPYQSTAQWAELAYMNLDLLKSKVLLM